MNSQSSLSSRATEVYLEEKFQIQRAVVVQASGPALQERAVESVHKKEVLIRVEALGLCRTDLRVYDGKIPVAIPLVPGHEFAGVVECVGADVTHVVCGDRVAINPVLACGDCPFCDDQLCQQTQFLGLDVNGACAEICKVPSSAVYKISKDLPFEVAAFAEPVAASLAVLNADIKRDQRGLLLGDNRIAVLTQRILQAFDFSNVAMASPEDLSSLEPHCFDYAIETLATTQTIRGLVRSVKPGGLVILKSRQQVPIELTLAELLPKNIKFQCVNYGRFDKALDLLTTGEVEVRDLVGPAFGLSDFEEAFEYASENESSKTFIRPQLASISANGNR
ncbi:MAG: alcohol dehydrogenase catalytic domain-containing protein [Planctomycetota bacterium]